MNPWIALSIGFIIGNLIGIGVMAVLSMAGEMDRIQILMDTDGSLEPVPPGYGPQAFNVVGDWGEPDDPAA